MIATKDAYRMAEIERLRYRKKQKAKRIADDFITSRAAFSHVNRHPGFDSLGFAIVEQAIIDYATLWRSHAVKNMTPDIGMVRASHRQQKYIFKGIAVSEVQHTVNFLKRDCARLLDLLDSKLTPEMIVKGVLEKERKGELESWQGKNAICADHTVTPQANMIG